MSSPGTVKRLKKYGLGNFIKSWDTIAGIITFALLYISTGGGLDQNTGVTILQNITVVSATLFAIVLTGFTVITSFTDRYFLLAWKKIDKFDDIVTLFQYNLALPIFVLLISYFLFIRYNGLIALFLISLFIYMLFSLISLVGFISTYALQRAEFVTQSIEQQQKSTAGDSPEIRGQSIEQLEEIKQRLEELKELQLDSPGE